MSRTQPFYQSETDCFEIKIEEVLDFLSPPWELVKKGSFMTRGNLSFEYSLDSGCWKFLLWIATKLFYQFTFNGTFICDARNFISVSDWQLLNKTRVNLMLCLSIANVSNLNFEGHTESFFQSNTYVCQKKNPNVA